MMTEWWREMEIGSRRDQISLPVVAKQLGVEIAGLGPPQVDARNHPMLSLVKHPGRREVEQDVTLPAIPRKVVDLDAISMDVGICVYNSLDETRACLESVAANRRAKDCIIIVDDASAEPTAAYLDEFAKTHDNVKLVRHEVNRGYTASANDVLKSSTADWAVLLNSDAVLSGQSLSKMIVCGEQFPQIGVVGALSNAASWQTVPQLTGTDGKFLVNQIPPGMSIDDMDRVCGELSTGVPAFVPLINGFCYAIRRELIEKIGYFDEESFPQGYGEEDDFCLRAGAAGFICAIATDSYVYHVKSATFTSDRRKPLVEAGVQVLRRKHSAERLKAAVESLKRHPELRRIRNRIAERLRELAPPLVPVD
jgi:GT2 family glycosyltransferase